VSVLVPRPENQSIRSAGTSSYNYSTGNKMRELRNTVLKPHIGQLTGGL